MLVCCIAYIRYIGFHYCKDFNFTSAALFHIRAASEKYLHIFESVQNCGGVEI
jgi:hypothetical protein